MSLESQDGLLCRRIDYSHGSIDGTAAVENFVQSNVRISCSGNKLLVGRNLEPIDLRIGEFNDAFGYHNK